jgi:hypothetical protein
MSKEATRRCKRTRAQCCWNLLRFYTHLLLWELFAIGLDGNLKL